MTDARPIAAPEMACVTGRQKAIPRFAWGIVFLALALRIGAAFATHFSAEDALITLRSAEHLARGQGLVYNTGEPVLGTTTPLYALILALAARIGLPALACGKAITIAADSLLCLVLYRWLSDMGRERAGRLAAFCAACNPFAIRWAISGMESSLVALGIALALSEYARRRYMRLFATLGALFLLRWDTALLAGALAAASAWRERRVPLKELALYSALITPWLIYASVVYGSPLPGTAAAKITVYGWRAGDTLLPQLGKLLAVLFAPPGPLALSLLAMAGLPLALRSLRREMVPPLLWVALYAGAFLGSKMLLFEWYLVPPLPVVTALAALGADALMERIRFTGRASAAAIWSAGGLFALAGLVSAIWVCRQTQSVEDYLRLPIALWLRDHAAPGERVMLEPIGYIGYHSGLPVLDTAGLVSPEVLPFWRRTHQAPVLDMAYAFCPDWAVLRPGELERVRRVGLMAGKPWDCCYALASTFSYTRSATEGPIVYYIFHRR